MNHLGSIWRKGLLSVLLGLVGNTSWIWAQASVQPELYTYHSFGNRGSSYTTVAGGLSFYLMDREAGGPRRHLQILGLMVPQESLGLQAQLGDRVLQSSGQGLELVLHDQWADLVGKGAQISLRSVRWADVQSSGDQPSGSGSVNLFHMGWNGPVASFPDWWVWFLGLDLAQLHLPGVSYGEAQVAGGFRLNW